MKTKTKVFIPEPHPGDTFQDKDGERWVIIMADRGFVHAVRHQSSESRYLTRKSWRHGFLFEGWLMV